MTFSALSIQIKTHHCLGDVLYWRCKFHFNNWLVCVDSLELFQKLQNILWKLFQWLVELNFQDVQLCTTYLGYKLGKDKFMHPLLFDSREELPIQIMQKIFPRTLLFLKTFYQSTERKCYNITLYRVVFLFTQSCINHNTYWRRC